MTRSVTIVNTSNWEHEDFTFDFGEKHIPVTLKPGEQHTIHPYAPLTIKAEPVEEHASRPFVFGKLQLFPDVDVALRSTDGKVRVPVDSYR